MSRYRAPVLAVALVAAVALGAARALGSDAASPGRNGLIAFISNRSGSPSLWTMHTDGTRPRKVADRVDGQPPAWSPDGRLIAFTRSRSQHSVLTTVRPNGTGARTYSMDGGGLVWGYWPSWFPDGNRLAMNAEAEVFTVSLKTGVTTSVAVDDGTNPSGDVTPYHPSVSPDGKQIAYVVGYDQGLIYTQSFSGKDKGWGIPLAVKGGALPFQEAPDWSPDGKVIAYQQLRLTDCDSNGNCVSDVYAVSSRGGKPKLLIRDAEHPSWSPDGTRILFQRLVRGSMQVFVAMADGTRVKRLTSGSENSYADWQPAR